MSNIEKIRQYIERRIALAEKCAEAACEKNLHSTLEANELLIRQYKSLLTFIDSLPEESENNGCGVEFPHFGADYPDAKCIDGYLWDMDSYEDGFLTIGGDDPCPICNTEEWLKDVLDEKIFKTRDEALEYVKMLKTKYMHKDSLPEEKPSGDLNKLIQKWDRIDINTVLKVKVKATGKVIDGFYDGRGHFDHFIDHDVFDRYSIDEVELMPKED